MVNWVDGLAHHSPRCAPIQLPLLMTGSIYQFRRPPQCDSIRAPPDLLVSPSRRLGARPPFNTSPTAHSLIRPTSLLAAATRRRDLRPKATTTRRHLRRVKVARGRCFEVRRFVCQARPFHAQPCSNGAILGPVPRPTVAAVADGAGCRGAAVGAGGCRRAGCPARGGRGCRRSRGDAGARVALSCFVRFVLLVFSGIPPSLRLGRHEASAEPGAVPTYSPCAN